MQMNPISTNPVFRTVPLPFALLMLVGSIVIPLTGCTDGGGNSPAVSSLSTPSDSQANPTTQSDSHSAATNPPAEENSQAAEPPTGPGEEEPAVTVTSTSSGATARLTWDKSSDPAVVGYNVYYGKKSSEGHGSCSYEESQSVEAPPATISGLAPNTPYFFAISAYGGSETESTSESPCSNEVIVVTPAVGS